MSTSTKLESNCGLLAKYMALKQPDNLIQANYVWIDGRQGLRAKTKTVNFVPKSASDLPVWNFDGSSTYQSDGSNADVYLKPVQLYNDPFRGGNNKLVLCETITYEGKPTESNTRNTCNLVMELIAEQMPWFGIEQEYSLLDGDDRTKPLGWPAGGFPEPPGPYYCGVGANKVYGRDVVEAHYRACLYAGINIAGENAEGMLSQWEFQIGPCKGISIGDDLWMARYILHRIAEDFHIGVSLDPKLVPGDWYGAGAHTNFSTKAMREKHGLAHIEAAMPKLERTHAKHIAKYDPSGGADNRRRLTGARCTAPIDQFSWAVDSRFTSIRIPRLVALAGCGYLEDRRPASNMDPYVVAEQLVRTICLDE